MATIKERAMDYAEIAKIRGDMPLELAEDIYILRLLLSRCR